MTLPAAIDQTTPIGTDSPADAPAQFQEIKEFIVGVFGITNGSTYTLPAMSIDPTTSHITISQTGFTIPGLVVTQGTITSALEAVNITTTWNGVGVTFDAFIMDATVTAGNAASRLINLKANATSQFSVTRTGAVSATGSYAVGTAPATTGALRIENNAHLTARNAVNSADISVITLDGSNRVSIAQGGGAIQWGTPRVSAGGGTTASINGTAAIGGAGQPATAAQAGWLKVVNSAGTTEYVPTWQ